MDIGLSIVHTLSELGAFSESKISKNMGSCGGNMHVFGIQWEHGGRFLENICTGMLKVDFRMLTISIPVYCKKKQTNKQTNETDHYTSLVWLNQPISILFLLNDDP